MIISSSEATTRVGKLKVGDRFRRIGNGDNHTYPLEKVGTLANPDGFVNRTVFRVVGKETCGVLKNHELVAVNPHLTMYAPQGSSLGKNELE